MKYIKHFKEESNSKNNIINSKNNIINSNINRIILEIEAGIHDIIDNGASVISGGFNEMVNGDYYSFIKINSKPLKWEYVKDSIISTIIYINKKYGLRSSIDGKSIGFMSLDLESKKNYLFKNLSINELEDIDNNEFFCEISIMVIIKLKI